MAEPMDSGVNTVSTGRQRLQAEKRLQGRKHGDGDNQDQHPLYQLEFALDFKIVFPQVPFRGQIVQSGRFDPLEGFGQ